jgi:hypothetical protein
MAQIGGITVDELSIIEVDADPSIAGLSAEVSSLALLRGGSAGKMWVKTGSSNTAWSRATDASELYGIVLADDTRYVSKIGNDSTGDGSPAKPFLTVNAALASITDNATNKRYKIIVGPGTYTETPITLKAYVDLQGAGDLITIIEASNSAAHLLTPEGFNVISHLKLTGATGSGKCGAYCSSSVSSMATVSFESVAFGANDIQILSEGITYPSNVFCFNVLLGSGHVFTRGFVAKNSGQKAKILVRTSRTNQGLTAPYPSEVFSAEGANSEIIIIGCTIRSINGTANVGAQAVSGGALYVLGTNLYGFVTAIKDSGTDSSSKIKISGTILENCTNTVTISNPTTTGLCDSYLPYATYSINTSSQFFVANKDHHLITVGKTGCDFSSIHEACAAITDSSSTNLYTIQVNPGIYTEQLITVPNYVSITGINLSAVTVTPDASTHHVFNMGLQSEISFLTIKGLSGAGYAAIACVDSGDWSMTHKVSITDCDIGILVSSNSVNTTHYAEYVDFNGTYTHAVHSIGTGGFTSYANVENFYNSPTTCSTAQFEVSGPGCRMELHLGEVNGISTDIGAKAINGAQLHITGVDFIGSAIGIHVPNTGSAPDLKISCTIEAVTTDILIEHPGTTGTFIGMADRSLSSVNSSSPVSMAYAGYGATGGFTVLKDLYQGSKHSELINLSKLTRQASTMGRMTGGAITVSSGRTISVSAGTGFIKVAGVITEISWATTTPTIPANETHYIYVNSTGGGTVTSATSPVDLEDYVALGRVRTDASNIVFIESTPMSMPHHGNEVEEALRAVLGAVYGTGSTVTENGNRGLDVTLGSYHYGTVSVLPSGGTGISWTEYFHASSAWSQNTSVSTVQNTQYDNLTGLTNMTASYYRKDAVYTVGSGGNEKYFVVTGQAQYSTLGAAQTATLPTPPAWLSEGVVLIASIVVQQGATNFADIRDERPRVGFQSSSSGGGGGVTAHGSLTGLGNDDHTQYLLVSGTRAMTGALNMGSQNITSVGTVDGVTVSAHASRHLPNGSDPITTAAAVSVSTANATGTANSLARSDHTHAGVGAYKVDSGTARTGTLNLLAGYGMQLTDSGTGDVTVTAVVATAQLILTHTTGLNMDYTSGNVIINGTYVAIVAGTVTGTASVTNEWVYVDTSGAVVVGATLPAGAHAIAQYTSNVSVITNIYDRRTYTNQNQVFAAPTTSLSAVTTNAQGSAFSTARSDHSHAITTGTTSSTLAVGNDSRFVTNGDSHDHNGGDGAQINHTTLSNIGTNTHAQIDTHIASTLNPHSVTATQVGLGSVNNTADTAKTITGDVTGTLGGSTVAKLQGRTVATTAPTTGQTLTWNGTSSQWEPQTDSDITSLTGDVTASGTGAVAATVARIQGVAVAATAPTSGQILTYNSGASNWAPAANDALIVRTFTTTSNAILTLTASSTNGQIFTGTVGGQRLKLPNATTLTNGYTYYLTNASVSTLPVYNNGSTLIGCLFPDQEAKLILISNATTDGVWSTASYAPDYNQSRVFDDFVHAATATNTIGSQGWTLTTGTVSYQAATSARMGVLRAATTVANSGSVAISLGTTLPVVLGNGITVWEAYVSIPTLGGATTAAFTTYVGLQDTTAATEAANGVYFVYDGIAAGTINWACRTSAASTRTSTNSGVAVSAGAWYKLTAVVNAGATAVDFYINNLWVANHTTNIPTAPSAPNLKIAAGAVSVAAKTTDIDYFNLIKSFSTIR